MPNSSNSQAGFWRRNKLVPRDKRGKFGELAEHGAGTGAQAIGMCAGAIDPEDVSSHYNLMIIYQKLGMRDDAKREAAIFKDLKDDPQVTSLASNFLQANWNIGNESLPFHTHDLTPFQTNQQKTEYLALLQ